MGERVMNGQYRDPYKRVAGNSGKPPGFEEPIYGEGTAGDEGFSAAALGFTIGNNWSYDEYQDEEDVYDPYAADPFHDYQDPGRGEWLPQMAGSPGMGQILAIVSIISILFILFSFFFMRSRFQAGALSQIEPAQSTGSVVISGAGQEEVEIPLPAGEGIAPFFAPSVQYWENQIVGWAARHNLDPNMVATVMQIESCGDPEALSRAGAQGLFQVMPYHFAEGENAMDPDTNALRGMNYLADRLIQTEGDVGRAFAGYNGGHVAAATGWDNWVNETQRYYTWSTGIYAEAVQSMESSPTLDRWMAAGGASLCAQAEARLGLR